MYDFRRVEDKILDFWQENAIFEKSLKARKRAKRFVFFEGPPTANGRPGIHHFLGRAFKDLYGRYKTMSGFFVFRKAGWDTHGLPVEIEVEKQLGFKTKKDIENYGIAKFNQKAKESVWKYKSEWEDMTRKMGFWVDVKHPYITYENNYIETLWHIIRMIWDKGLLYLAHKVVPFCARCGTSLSAHEVAQGYRTVTDKAVTVKFSILNFQFSDKFKIPKKSKLYILAWTTTPWTLPGNIALAIGGSIKYQVVSIKGKNETYILAEDLAPKVLNTEYKIQNTVLGSDLVGLEYEPLFDVTELKSEKSYKVYEADFVSTEDGTGVVHTAVMYGEDDYELGTKLGLPKVHTVDEQGKFMGVGKDFDGLVVKHKDKPTEEKTTQKIIDYLKDKNTLLKEEEYEHDYPFCWRCDSPLLYYAKSSWFIKMSTVREQLIKNNQKVNWLPEHIKDGRFGQWLKEGKDWAFSRERYWGTPLPVWQCQKCGEHEVIGSVEEIEKNYSPAKRNNYFVLRHSYTSRHEKEGGLVGTDIKNDPHHLTTEGRKLIEKEAQFIKNNHDIDFIYSSPFMRTMESAEIVGKLIHKQVHREDRIGEIVHGGCEGKPYKSCPAVHVKVNIDSKAHELGESWNDIRLRMADFIREMESTYSGKNILIVSHGDPIWLLDCIGQGATGEEIAEDSRNGKFYYPKIGEFKKLDWKAIPRNEHGELDLHRPYIDSVVLKCKKCGASMKKIPDLIDVWFDSGAMPYAQWHWPFENNKIFEDQFPADFISEAIDQTRGWFYTLLAISTLLDKGTPYKNVICYSHVLDEHGKKMSKSKGNVVSPFEVMDKVGADTARWYFYTLNSPGEYKLFSMRDVEGKLKGFIFTLQNCIRFYELYIQETAVKGGEDFINSRIPAHNLLDKWIISKLNGLIFEISEKLNAYDPVTAARAIEKFVVEDLSNWWLRRSRKRKGALPLLRSIMRELAKLLAPFTPFLAEDVYKRTNQQSTMNNEQPESVHLCDWPKANKKLINKKLEDEMEEVRDVVAAGLAIRKDKQLKVRQPLKRVSIRRLAKFAGDLEGLIKDELNIKEISYEKKQESHVVLDMELDTALINEGFVRELVRQIQDMRKESKYKLDEKIFGRWHSDDNAVSEAVSEWSEYIKEEALLKNFMAGHDDKEVFDIEKEFELAPQKKIWVGIRK